MIDIASSNRVEIEGAICRAIGIARRDPKARRFSKRELVALLAWIAINLNATKSSEPKRPRTRV